MSKHLVILLAGMYGRQRDAYIPSLKKMTDTLEPHGISSKILRTGVGWRNLGLTLPNGEKREYHFRESYWGDLVPSLSDLPLPNRLAHGLYLLTFFISFRLNPMAKAAKGMRFMQTLFLLGSVLLLVWYIGCIYTLASANGIPIRKYVADSLGVASYPILLLLSLSIFLIGVRAFRAGVDIAYVFQAYMNNARNIQSIIRGRVMDALEKAAPLATYDSVTVFAHSFGSVIAVEAIANPSFSLPKMRLITAGSPLQLVVHRDDTFRTTIESCLARSELTSWIEYCAPRDPFSTIAPLPETGKASQHIIDIGVTFFEAWSGIGHHFYFSDPRIAKCVFGIE